MRSGLGGLTLLALLAGGMAACGDDERVSGTGYPEATPDGAADPAVVRIVSASAAGGQVSTAPTHVDDRLALLRYVGRFDSEQLTRRVIRTVEQHQEDKGRVVAAAVISIGCDVPPTAIVTETDDGYEVTPGKVAAPKQECLVPVTSVAVLDLPADAFPDRPDETVPAD